MDEDGYVVGPQWIIQQLLLHIEDVDELQAQGGKCAYQRWKKAGQTTAELFQALARSRFSFRIASAKIGSAPILFIERYPVLQFVHFGQWTKDRDECGVSLSHNSVFFLMLISTLSVELLHSEYCLLFFFPVSHLQLFSELVAG